MRGFSTPLLSDCVQPVPEGPLLKLCTQSLLAEQQRGLRRAAHHTTLHSMVKAFHAIPFCCVGPGKQFSAVAQVAMLKAGWNVVQVVKARQA